MTHLHVIDQLCRYPNVYADTSGVRYGNLLVQAVKRAGPHKLLFGSDGPLLHPALELQVCNTPLRTAHVAFTLNDGGLIQPTL